MSAVAAVYIGFLGVEVAAAERFIRQWGYHVIGFTFACWLMALWKMRSDRASEGVRLWPAIGWGCGALVAIFSLMSWVHEEFRSKILYDEFVVQSTAYNMHFFREVATMVRGYDILGVFVSTDNYLDKRPYFFPFLVSLVHDLTGYRPANAHVLNAAFYPVALLLGAAIGRRIAGRWGGFAAVALLGALPLLAQNATGSGLELLNLVMVLACAALGAAFVEKADEQRLAAFLFGVLLLAQTRYESVLYVVSAGLILFAGWWRSGRIVIGWSTALVPLLLVPVALHNRVLSNSPALWELRENQSARFSVEYLGDNVIGAVRFFFSRNIQHANSLLLASVGIAGFIWLLVLLARRGRPFVRFEPAVLALLSFALVIVANTALVQFYYWASFDDNMSARFSLPLHLLFAFSAVAAAGSLDGRFPALRLLACLALVFAIGSAVPKSAHHLYSHLGIDEIEWERRFVQSRGAHVDRIIITNKSTLPWLIRRTPSILLQRAPMVADRLARQLKEPTFGEILVTQSLRPSTSLGDHQLVPAERLPDWFQLETIGEKRFGTKLARISRLVAVSPPPDHPALIRAESESPPDVPAAASE